LITIWFGVRAAAAIVALSALAIPVPALAQQSSSTINRGVVELETTGSAGISVRIAEDLANLLDDGATRRVVPVVGKGALQNLLDLKYLRGVDIAILQLDVLDYAKEQRVVPGLDAMTYITKLYNEEFHLLARPEIKAIADLANKKVNVDLRGSGTAITASRLFGALNIAVTATNDSQEVALEKLRAGEIAALAFVAGKPAPLFANLKPGDQLHFISVPFESATGEAYVPARLTTKDYPGLVAQDGPVETIAVGSVLAVADLRQVAERYRNVANFVDAFFTGFQSLLGRATHPKWQEVNISAEVRGWRRYQPAEQWLQRNLQAVAVKNPEDLRVMFSKFIDERRQASGGAPMSGQEKEQLFQQFKAWQGEQAR